MRNVRLTVAYDGTDFHGFAMNGELRTVMGELSRRRVAWSCANRSS